MKKMKNLTIPENTTLVTMDVTSLYTNIPHDDGIAAFRKIWEQRTDQESKNSSSSLSPCVHFMSTSSINRNHERGCLSDERSNRSSRFPIKMLA
jgi:hypothetical protein